MGKHPTQKNEAAFALVEDSKMPNYIHGDKAAGSLWRKLAPLLIDAKLLTTVDVEALAMLCKTWSEYQAVTKQLDTEGRVTSWNGNLKDHPLVGQQTKLADRLLKLWKQFGLTPAARSGVSSAETQLADELQKFIDVG